MLSLCWLLMQVVRCVGASGSNAEYVTRLADFVRRHIPHDDDRELFQLDAQVRHLLTTTRAAAASAHVGSGCSLHDPAASHSVAPASFSSGSSGVAVKEQCDVAATRDHIAAPARTHTLVVSVLAAG